MKTKNKCWIVTKNPQFFQSIVDFEKQGYNFCSLEEMILPDRIAYDSETTGLNPFENNIFAIQLGTGENNYLIDLQNYDTALGFTEYQNKTQTLEEVVPYFIDKELVGQNIIFDLGFLNIKNYFPRRIFDTMIQSKIYWNGSPPNLLYGFSAIMERELGIVYDKTEQKNIATVQLSQLSTISYSFNDVDRLLEAHDSLWKKLEQQGSIHAYLLHCRHARALSYIQLCGLPLDEYRWRAKMEHDRLKMKEFSQSIIDYIWNNLPQFRDNQMSLFETTKNINIDLTSPKQMIEVFKSLNIDIIDDKGKESINEKTIQKSNHEFVKLWLDFQEFQHRCSTFGKNILSKIRDGRIYTSFNQIINTARLSTRKGEINFLNFPSDKDTRKCFVASKNYKMLCCDYEGQENICNADKTGDKAMLEAVLSGRDLHCAFARMFFSEIESLSDEEIRTMHKDKRTYMKAPRFALSYGASAHKLSSSMNIPIEEATKIETLYKELHSGVFKWGEKIFNEAIKTGHIETEMGFKLRLPEYDTFTELDKVINNHSKSFWSSYSKGKKEFLNKETTMTNDMRLYLDNKENISKYFKKKGQYYRLCLNAPIQTMAAFQTKFATVLLFEYIEAKKDFWKARISNIIHDECLMEVSDELVEEYREKLSYFMKKGGNYFLKNPILMMKAETNVGESWYDAK